MSKTAKAYVDGASRNNPGEAGYGAIITIGKKQIKLSGFLGKTTNNAAEYLSLISALEFAVESEIEKLMVYSDSELVVKQLKGEYKTRNPLLKKLHAAAGELIDSLKEFRINHIPRSENKRADKLANKAIDEKRTSLLKDYLELKK